MDSKPVLLQNGLARIVPEQWRHRHHFPAMRGAADHAIIGPKKGDNLGEGAEWLWVKSGKFAGH
jgi:hypothetical protein